jgi:hypothetical protein
MTVRWIEKDDKRKSSTVSMTVPGSNGLPSTTTSVTIKEDDYDMGGQVMLYTDGIYQMYDCGLMQWKDVY